MIVSEVKKKHLPSETLLDEEEEQKKERGDKTEKVMIHFQVSMYL